MSADTFGRKYGLVPPLVPKASATPLTASRTTQKRAVLSHFEGCTEETPPPENLVIPYCKRPLSVVTVSDGAMRPALEPGQQVYVQAFRPRGVGYIEQRFALRYKGRVLVRRVAVTGDGYCLVGSRDGFEIDLPFPDGWERPDDWHETGVIHPDCTAIGPLVTARGGSAVWPHNTYIATAGWSN